MKVPGSRGTGVDPAVRQARMVVGLYGDPAVTWSVLLRLRLRTPLDPARVSVGIEAVHAAHPHLGPPPVLGRYDAQERGAVLSRAADDSFGDRGPLVRVALDHVGSEIVVAVHHGCVDGLGLLGYTAAITGVDLPSSARGVPPAAEPQDFLRGSARRLREAFLHPPVRVASSGRTPDVGDVLLSREVAGGKVSTAELLLASVRTVRAWNAVHRARQRPVVVALGLSRRRGTPTPPPDRDSAYARLAADGVESLAHARRLLAQTRPEPAFPVTRAAGFGPIVTRVLGSRLGSSLLVSNLGLVGQRDVESAEFWPVPTGPAGVCVGLASSPARTTLTVRVRRAWFRTDEAGAFADQVLAEVDALSRDPSPDQ